MHKTVAALVSERAAYWLAILGLALIIIGNTFQHEYANVDIDGLICDVGALLLVIGVLQWLFDTHVRSEFFAQVRSEIIDNRHVADSGMCDFFANSKEVNFSEFFLTSEQVAIGVNYSPKLIDNAIDLLERRTAEKRKTTIIHMNPESPAGKFLADEYAIKNIPERLETIHDIVKRLDPKKKYITILAVNTVLCYSFVLFDSRAWIVMGTNGLGRRAVPGFMVKHESPWFSHFKEDIRLLQERIDG